MENQQTPEEYTTLKDFYVYYLTEHANITSLRLHFVGTSLVIGILLYALFVCNYTLLWCMPLAGYGFAWAGHFFFEKNKPATFKYPFYSLASDFIMFFDILKGKVKI